MELIPVATWVAKDMRLGSPGTYSKTKCYYYRGRQVTKETFQWLCDTLVDHCLAQPLSEEFPPATDGNKYRHTAVLNTKRHLEQLLVLTSQYIIASMLNKTVTDTFWMLYFFS